MRLGHATLLAPCINFFFKWGLELTFSYDNYDLPSKTGKVKQNAGMTGNVPSPRYFV